jgi:plasmid stabilization system protein ParE
VIYRFMPEAAADLEEAIDWYDGKEPGAGDKFHERVLVTLRLVAENPNAFPFFEEPFRVAWVNPYPYLIVYDVRPNSVRVVFVFHTSRHPGRIAARLQDLSDE